VSSNAFAILAELCNAVVLTAIGFFGCLIVTVGPIVIGRFIVRRFKAYLSRRRERKASQERPPARVFGSGRRPVDTTKGFVPGAVWYTGGGMWYNAGSYDSSRWIPVYGQRRTPMRYTLYCRSGEKKEITEAQFNALKESLEHHRRVLKGEDTDIGGNLCPCCKQKHSNALCPNSCVIGIYANGTCYETPWRSVRSHICQEHNRVDHIIHCDQCTECARLEKLEVEFLEEVVRAVEVKEECEHQSLTYHPSKTVCDFCGKTLTTQDGTIVFYPKGKAEAKKPPEPEFKVGDLVRLDDTYERHGRLDIVSRITCIRGSMIDYTPSQLHANNPKGTATLGSIRHATPEEIRQHEKGKGAQYEKDQWVKLDHDHDGKIRRLKERRYDQPLGTTRESWWFTDGTWNTADRFRHATPQEKYRKGALVRWEDPNDEKVQATFRLSKSLVISGSEGNYLMGDFCGSGTYDHKMFPVRQCVLVEPAPQTKG
jgi:hypothetical protein